MLTVVHDAEEANCPDRALTWITRKIEDQTALVVIEGVGSYGAGLADRVAHAGLLVAELSVMPAAERRGVGKTDALDAVRIARSVLGVDTARLRRPRATGQPGGAARLGLAQINAYRPIADASTFSGRPQFASVAACLLVSLSPSSV